MPNCDIGTGATIGFGTSGYTAEIVNIDAVSATREAVDCSHMGTTVAREFIPGDLIDWGDLVVEINFDQDDEPPLDQAAETITITYPKKSSGSASGATLVGSGFMTGFDITVPLEDKMTATFTVKWTGDLTWTDEA